MSWDKLLMSLIGEATMAGRQYFVFKGYAVALKVVGKLRALSFIAAVNQVIGASFGIALFALVMLASLWLSAYPVPEELLIGLLIGDLLFMLLLTAGLYFFTRDRRLLSALGVDELLVNLAQTKLPFEPASVQDELSQSATEAIGPNDIQQRLDRVEELLLALAEDRREQKRAAVQAAERQGEVYIRTGSAGP